MSDSYGISSDERYSPKELAKILGICTGTLRDWRYKKKGPPYIKYIPGENNHGGRIYYPKGAFEEWLKTTMHNI